MRCSAQNIITSTHVRVRLRRPACRLDAHRHRRRRQSRRVNWPAVPATAVAERLGLDARDLPQQPRRVPRQRVRPDRATPSGSQRSSARSSRPRPDRSGLVDGWIGRTVETRLGYRPVAIVRALGLGRGTCNLLKRARISPRAVDGPNSGHSMPSARGNCRASDIGSPVAISGDEPPDPTGSGRAPDRCHDPTEHDDRGGRGEQDPDHDPGTRPATRFGTGNGPPALGDVRVGERADIREVPGAVPESEAIAHAAEPARRRGVRQ